MSKPLSFDQVADFVRGWARVGPHTPVTPETQFERDLNITGMEAFDLLEDAETEFAVELSDSSFNLAQNERLFHTEGMEPPPILQSLLHTPEHAVKALSVGELYEAILRERSLKDR